MICCLVYVASIISSAPRYNRHKHEQYATDLQYCAPAAAQLQALHTTMLFSSTSHHKHATECHSTALTTCYP
jgi:hypothetical protein